MKTPTRQVYETILVVLLFLTACAPAVGPQEVIATQHTTALWVIQDAARGASQSIRMASPNGIWLFARYIPEEGWAFTSVDMMAKDIIGKWRFCGGGNFTSCTGMADLVEGLLARGWDFKDPSQLPPGFTDALAAASSWITRMNSIPALIIPAGSFDIMPDILGVKDNDT